MLTLARQALVAVVTELHSQLNNHPDADSEKAGASDLGHDDLEVRHVVGAGNQGSRTAQGPHSEG
jgi:hypothetical protein